MSRPLLNEDKFLINSARLIRTARKKMGLTQIDLASKLGVSQSCLSKFESGILMPSAVQWAIFCQMTMLPSDTIFYGVIDGLSAKFLDKHSGTENFKLHNKYKEGHLFSMRFLRPFFMAVLDEVGEEKFELAFKRLKTDPDFINVMSHQLPWNFVSDFMEVLELDKINVQKILNKRGNNYFNQSTLGETYVTLNSNSNDFDRVNTYLELMMKAENGLNILETSNKKDRLNLALDIKKLNNLKKKIITETCCLKEVLRWEVEQVYDYFQTGKKLIVKELMQDTSVEMEFMVC